MSSVEALPLSLKEKLAALQAALLAENPGFQTILAEIHSLTKGKPEYVYAMSDEEFETTIQALGRLTNVTIDAPKAKKVRGQISLDSF